MEYVQISVGKYGGSTRGYTHGDVIHCVPADLYHITLKVKELEKDLAADEILFVDGVEKHRINSVNKIKERITEFKQAPKDSRKYTRARVWTQILRGSNLL